MSFDQQAVHFILFQPNKVVVWFIVLHRYYILVSMSTVFLDLHTVKQMLFFIHPSNACCLFPPQRIWMSTSYSELHFAPQQLHKRCSLRQRPP